MGNNLYKIEKDLRSIAKRYKSVKYSLGLAILFLMMGISAFSEDVTTEVATRQEIKNSVGNVQTKLNVLREENEEQIKKLRLELLQLMEQGDQVVKSPWSSWQFGMNYFYENWGSSYKGNGDKAQKYVFNGIYTRGNWKVRNAKDTIENARAGGKPLTPGTDSISSWKNISNSSSGGVIINKDNSINSSTNGNRNWGLVNLEDLKEPTNEVEILARISPKEVTKQAITLNITEPVVGTMEAPVINPQVNEPLPAPKIETPEIENVTINQLTINAPNAPVAPSAPVISIGITAPSAPVAPSAPNAPVAPNAPSVQSITVTPSTPSAPSAPTISITVTPPQIEALSITTPGEVGTISVTPPTINPVDFMLSPRGLSSDTNRNFLNRAYNLNGQNISVNTQGNYISTWGRATNLDGVNTNVTVTADDTRAFMIDEGIDYKDATVKPFRYIGTITLNNSKNVGIDVQGTHTKYSGETNTGPGMNQIENVANIQVINEGTIVGNGGPNVKNQVGFGFNNFDASTNNTRTEMINRGNGSVTLGAPESAGIQLRPEDPWSNSNNSQRGLNMMTGENSGTVSINSYGSFGILTVKNRDLDKFKSNPASTALAKVRDYNNYAVKSTAGGQIASRAQEANMSYIKNTGTINVNGDSSVGVGLLHNIQGVTLGGIVNVGTNNPSSFTYSDKTGGTSGKIDGAVGIYTEVETRPILNGDYDDHALQNTTGRTIGTETIEVSGNVNIGDYAIGSSGLRIKDKGSITLKNGGKINVGGENNYGAIVEGTNYDYYRKTQANAYAENGTKYTATGRVNLEQGSSINVTGKSSIAYVLKSGKGSNAGTIEVTGDKGNTATSASFNGSLGFYGVKGEFTNTGTISTKGKIAHAVALVGDLTDGITFKNNGKISVEDAGNIGVYASGKYIFEHSGTNAKISVGSNALGIYAKNSTGTLNINAPIELGNSSSGGTTIGIYSDGDAKVKFGAGSKLTIGEGAVGLYSSDATKFNNTFTIENGKSLEIVLAKNSTFGLIKGPSSTSPILSKYLNNNLTDKINITSFGEGASLFYATDSAKVTLDNDYTVTNGGAASTAVLVGTNGSTVEITSGKTLTTNTNVALIGTKGAGTASTVLNNGNINSTRDSGIGIYAQGSNVTNSGSIKIQNQKSVAILGEDDSTLTNSGKIEIEKAQSAGIYGKNSTITNSGSGTNGIFVKEGASAGIYSLLTNNTDRKITNSGLIKLEDANKESSAGIYAKLESNTNKLETENLGTIEVIQKKSVGIYAENTSSQGRAQSIVENKNSIKVSGDSSVGIIGKKSKITNSGTGTNGIEISGNNSAGILVSDNSEVTNSGRIESKTGTSLVGISVDSTSTVSNSGTITIGTDSSTGISSKGGAVTNSKDIILNNQTSVGISSENGNVTNTATTGKIEVKNKESVGIYAKLTGSSNQIIDNSGAISLITSSGTPNKSAGIYSLYENSATGTLTTTNNGTISVDQIGSVGIFVKNSSNQDKTKSIAKNTAMITVSKEGSAGMLGEKSTLENSTPNGNITLSANKTAGMIGNSKSKVTNNAGITTATATPSNSAEGLVGISLNDSEGINEATGTITLGTDYSTGMYGEAKSTLTNKGNITGNNKNAVGMATKASTATNDSTITLTGADSTGMFGLAVGTDKSTLINNKIITGTGTGTVGIVADKTTAENRTGATITLEGKKSTGIFGKQGSDITNAGKIETKTAVPSTSVEGLVGIALNASKATNTSTGTIVLGTAYSTGMFGEANSILTNEGTISGSKENSVGIAGKNSTVTNKGNVTLEGKNSTGIFGETNSTLSNNSTATITVKEESSVGIYSKNNATTAKNAGTIVTEKKSSAGMYGDEGDLENTNSITAKAQESAGMYAKNANAVNKKSIVIEGKTSAGILLELNGRDKSISGSNETADGIITVKNESSAGMLGKVVSGTTGANAKLTLTNKNTITVDSKESVGIMVSNDSILTKDKVIASNEKTITLVSGGSNNKNIGILADKKATGFNTGDINVESKESVGMLGQNASSVINNKTITLTGVQGIGMLAKDANSAATNEDTINVNGKASLGMLSQTLGDVKNNKTIKVSAENGVGIFVSGTGKGSNSIGGTITLENKENVGIFAKNNGNTTFSAENAGNIVLGKPDKSTTGTSLIGMFAQAEAGKTASVKNIGTIYVNTKSSVGMYAKNDAANTDDADLHNAGTIYVNNESSAGIYAPKAKISKIGKITLEDSTSTNGSSAVYISNGGKAVDTEQAEISLGTKNQNRVAYYINGKDSALSGTNIGKIIGYGVGVYLQGNSSTDIAKIDSNTPILNYKANGANGKGIIGLFLNGDTDIQAYNGGITVGDTVEKNGSIPGDKPKYAIGIYAKGQGTSATPYNITTAITAGKNGVGIYADNDSNIKYTGNMEIGDGTTAGTGIFITKKMGAIGGKVELGSNTIKLKGTGGVAVIASEGTTFDGKNATIELEGTNVQGVGVYAKKGSTVNISNWTFNNHGNAAEEVRSEEGGAYITANKQLKPKMVLTHVINGETSIASGITVVSVHDGKYKAEANIGLMAEGVKNPVAPAPITWQEGNFEIVNKGTIDFSVAEKSTAIFANSARAKNDGVIKVGKNSTAIYGFYDSTTRKYEGAPVNPDPNKLELETTTNSKISLGDSSTGMYLINAEKIDNKGGEIKSETGATKNVGIYAINGQDTKVANNKILIMQNAANIILGNGSVGLYSKGQSNIVRNIVTNTGNITVGDKITGSPSVAMYAENTNLNTNSNIAVGKDGIAFYGKNSTIEAKGAVNFQNKGVLAYLEDSKFISHLGNLGATQNTMIYLKNSTAQLDGAGTKADIDVADGYTGAYIEGNSTLTGIKTIKLGKDSTGLYLKDASFISNAESITGTKNKARGILATNSNLINNSKISLSGEESVGIYSNADNTKTVINNGELTLAGKKTLGVFLKGSQSFENKANINIADSTNSKEPIIGIYTTEGTSNIKHTAGLIDVGTKSIGIYSTTNSNVEMNAGKIHIKDQGIGIYKQNGKVIIKGELAIDKHTATAKDSEPTGVYAVNGTEVNDQASKIAVGEKSYGFILNNTDSSKINVYNNTNTGTVSLTNDSVFLYSNGKAKITNNRTINANASDHLIAFYIKNGGNFINNGNIDFSSGKGNIGIYAPGGEATNKGKILVGKTDDIDPATGKVYTDVSKIVYGIGMAADNGGHIINEGEVRIYNNKSIGMYGSGIGTVVENKGSIKLDGSRATATDKIQSMTGVYVDEGATFRNYGTITTTDSYAGRDGKVNENVAGLTGVAVMNGSTLINEATGKILIDADNSSGVVIRGKVDSKGNVLRYAVIKNYGEIKVRGKGTVGISWKDVSQADIDELQRQINSKITSDPSGNEIGQASGTNKDFQGITITVKNGKPEFKRNGVLIPETEVEQITKLLNTNTSNLGMSNIGFYIDTLGRTKPVDFDGANPPVNSQLIVGTEYSEKTNKKEWLVKGEVIKPFLDQIQGRNFKLTSLAGSLTWIATPVLDNHGQITGIAMSKLSYTSFVKKTDNAYNFTDGLEQRYSMNALDSVEKRIFNKLNSIGKNEEALLTQAYDEMMGHQYANVQQRVQATGKILDKEFTHLRSSWSNPSKDSNKVKTFGMKGEYKTDTAGVIDYTNNAYGVAYVHESEDIKLGKGIGWYTGIVHNTFKFKDIGRSKEEQLQAKVGLFKSVPFDDNNSLNWTISGDIFVGHNKMHRKFLVVDEIFNAKSKYYTYGIGVRNEIGKEFRLSESFTLRPYAALGLEYGRVSKIKEKSGEIKLEVKHNDYLSIKPEVGAELAYKHYFGTKTLRTSVGVAYENELGRVANGKNKARVAGTTADWFNIRGEKEDRRGNVKVDLNVGLDNTRVGVTGNVGYDTKGNNVRGGVGLRVIF